MGWPTSICKSAKLADCSIHSLRSFPPLRYSERAEGQPFGFWSTDTNTIQMGGPRYNEAALDNAPRLSANKVSIVRAEPCVFDLQFRLRTFGNPWSWC